MPASDNGPVIVGVTWWLCFFSGAFLGLRIYAKWSRRQRLWWDDHILIASWVLLLIESIITQMGQLLGFGKHTVDIAPQNLATIALYTSIGASVSCFASTGSKISFGVTLLRLTTDKMRWFVWFCVVTLFVVMIPSSLLTWVQCTPREKAWNYLVEGTCWDPAISTNYGIFNAAWCAVIDFALAMLPWYFIWGLQMRTTEKAGVGIAMSLGVLSGVCAIVKGVYIIQLRQQDFYYNGIDVTIWTAVETATAIIAASIPVLRVFFKEKVSTLGYHGGSKDAHTSRNGRSHVHRSGNTSRVDAVHPDKDDSWMNLGPMEDAASTQSILGPDDGIEMTNSPGKTGILATSTVQVDYESSDEVLSPREKKNEPRPGIAL